jgi:hypothetical protein
VAKDRELSAYAFKFIEFSRLDDDDDDDDDNNNNNNNNNEIVLPILLRRNVRYFFWIGAVLKF